MTIILYSLLMIGIGFLCRGSARTAEGYFLAGRKLNALEVGSTMAATAFGGSAVLIASSYVYTHGLVGLWFSGSVALGFAVLGLFFASKIRASGSHSLAGFIGQRYGSGVQRIVSFLIVVVEITFFALTIKSFALLTNPLFGKPDWLTDSPTLFMAAIAAVFVIYTMIGGHKAVVVTSHVQEGIAFVGLFMILLPLALIKTDFSALPPDFLSPTGSENTGLPFILNMLALMGLTAIVGGDVFSKILSARDEQAARRGALIAAGYFGLFALGIALLALCARAVLPPQAEPELSALMLAKHLLPPGLVEIIAIGFLSALLSTGDSVLITGATVLALDVLKLEERAGMGIIRLLTLGLALAGFVLAVYFTGLLETMKFGYTLLTASVVAPVIFALVFDKRLQLQQGPFIAGIISGLSGASAWKIAAALDLKSRFDSATIGVGCSALVMVIGLFLVPQPVTKPQIIADKQS